MIGNSAPFICSAVSMVGLVDQDLPFDAAASSAVASSAEEDIVLRIILTTRPTWKGRQTNRPAALRRPISLAGQRCESSVLGFHLLREHGRLNRLPPTAPLSRHPSLASI